MGEDAFLYFAYGSNMLTERLHKRCPSARPLGNAIARGLSLSFCKVSKDGSGKATLLTTGKSEQTAYGVLFEVPQNERAKLDKVEGRDSGYDRDDTFRVICHTDGSELTVTTYIASLEACDKSLAPYEWYHALILAGALQHRLPESYISELRDTLVWNDPEPERESRQQALRVLHCAGFQWLLE